MLTLTRKDGWLPIGVQELQAEKMGEYIFVRVELASERLTAQFPRDDHAALIDEVERWLEFVATSGGRNPTGPPINLWARATAALVADTCMG